MEFDVGVIGLGYVRIPLARCMIAAGLRVVGIDIDADRVASLMQGTSPIGSVPDGEITLMRNAGFLATTDHSRAQECRGLVICVPTPLNARRDPDLSFITDTVSALGPHLRAGQMLSLESTTWPGTTAEVIAPMIAKFGLRPGVDIHLVYSPERENPGDGTFTTGDIPKVVGGHTPDCLARGVGFYQRFINNVVPVSSTQTAEMVKLVENVHRSVNIGLANEMKLVADGLGLDIFEVIKAAGTKPFGFTPFFPGPGIGGHCIPVDPHYLTWKAREAGIRTRLIEAAAQVNDRMPGFVLQKIAQSLNANGKPLQGARVLALGVTYKADVDDLRESAALRVMKLLQDWGAELSYADPHVPRFPKLRDYDFALTSTDLTAETIAGFDAVVLLTDHSSFDYDMIRENAKLLIDTRGRFHGSAQVVAA